MHLRVAQRNTPSLTFFTAAEARQEAARHERKKKSVEKDQEEGERRSTVIELKLPRKLRHSSRGSLITPTIRKRSLGKTTP